MYREYFGPSSPPLYLDGAATSRPHPEVREAMLQTMEDLYGNPSSPHLEGVRAETSLEGARKRVARRLGVDPRGIYFNSGATEGNNTIIGGVARAFRNRGRHVIITGMEHPSVREPCRALEELGIEVSLALPDTKGYVRAETIEELLRPETILVSVTAVSGEVGTIQPLAEIGEILRRYPEPRPVFHSDIVQAVGRIEIDIEALGLDCATISAHKLRGPRGVGALYLRPGLHIPPLILGGGQERGFRSGTENLPGIVGMALALDMLTDERSAWRSADVRTHLAREIQAALPGARVNGFGPEDTGGRSAPHILNVSFPGIPGEVLVHALEELGIFASTGAACSSRERRTNAVLKNMGLDRGRAESAIRFSWSESPTPEEADRLVAGLRDLVPVLANITS